MTPGIYSAVSALNARWSQQELTAQNISNVGTPGHKRQVSAFSAYLRNSLEPDLPPSATTLSVSQPPAYDMKNGPTHETKRPLDAAIIRGDGFFQVQVQTPQGTRTLLTRSGHFDADKNRQLVNAAGYPVLNDRGGTITLPSKGDIAISEDGSITVDGKAGGDKVGVVTLDKKDQGKLVSEGGLLFTAGDAQLSPVRDAQLLTTGHLESSNVELTTEMIQMIQNQRMYDMLTRAMQMQDDGLGRAIQDLSGV